MLPVLFSLGPLSISSFGFFLSLSFISAAFVCWRLAKVYDVNEEKIIDLVILTFFGGLIGARIQYVLLNLSSFSEFEKIFLVNRFPGLSFWGGLIGGALALIFFARRLKLNFWQIADFAGVAIILALAFGDLGCFFGGCSYGVVSNSPIAVKVVGLVGKRFPVSLIESLILFLAFSYLLKQATKFHFNGKIIALSLLVLGVVKFSLEYFRGDAQVFRFFPVLLQSQIGGLALIICGLVIFYRRSKRHLKADFASIISIITNNKRRELALVRLQKSCYNHTTNLKIRLGKSSAGLKSLPKFLRRKLNVKPTPTKLG